MVSAGKLAVVSDWLKIPVLYCDCVVRTVMRQSAVTLAYLSLLFSLSRFREEYGRLFDFVNGKHLRIKNTGKVRDSSKQAIFDVKFLTWLPSLGE